MFHARARRKSKTDGSQQQGLTRERFADAMLGSNSPVLPRADHCGSGSACFAPPLASLSPKAPCSPRPRSPLLTLARACAGTSAESIARPADDEVARTGTGSQPEAGASPDRPPASPHDICPICEDEPATEPISCLRHKFCASCMATYVETRILSGKARIECPSCDHELLPCEVERFIGSDWLPQFDRLQLQNSLMRPDVRFCPQPNCAWAVEIDFCTETFGADCAHNGPGQRMTCRACFKDFCLVCREPWHEGRNCEPTVLQIRDFTMGEMKPCPNCFMLVNKDTGCNVVNCRCGMAFCWLCLRPCNEATHFLPHKKCRLFTNKTSKPTLRWKQYGLLVLFSPLLAIPVALLGAGVGVATARASIVEGLSRIGGKRKRQAYIATSLGTAPVWVIGSGAVGAAALLVSGAVYLVCFPGLFVKEQVKSKRRAAKREESSSDIPRNDVNVQLVFM